MATGSISPGGANSWKPDVMAAFKTACEAEGWVTQENGYNDGTYTRWVFRNGNSNFAVMFFCLTSNLNNAVSSSSLGGGLFFVVGETYDGTNKEILRIAPLFGTWATDANCAIATAYTPASHVTAGSSGPGYYGFPAQQNGTTYWGGSDYFWWSIFENQAFIASDHFTTSTFSYKVYYGFGRFSSLLPSPVTNDPNPVYVALLGSTSGITFNSSLASGFTSSIRASTTNSAMNPSAPAHSFRIDINPEVNMGYWSSLNKTYAFITSASTSAVDKYNSNERLASRAVLVRFSVFDNQSDASALGFTRGILDDVVVFPDVAFNIRQDDDITIGSNEYIMTSNSFGHAVKKAP